MLFSPNENLNPTTADNPADSLLFYLDNPILPPSDLIFNLPNSNEQQSQLSQQDSGFHLLQNDKLSCDLSCVRPTTMLHGQDCATLSLDIQQGANRPPDTLIQSDQLAAQQHLSPSHSDDLNQELLTQLLNPEFFPTQPAETLASIGNSLFSPEINTPLRFNDIIFDDTVAASWPWPDPTPEINVTSSFNSSDLLNSFNNDFSSSTTANLFDVQASPSLSLAASLFNSDVFESPLQQNNPYPTPDMYQLDTFLSSIHPSLLPSTLPSPMATPAVSSVSIGTSLTTDFCPTPLCFPSTDINSFDLFPSLDDVSVSFGANQPTTENPSQIDPLLLSTLSAILQQHQQALSSANLTPDHVIAFLQALTSKNTPTEQSAALSSEAIADAECKSDQAEPVSESSSAGPIRRTPTIVKKRRITKMYACDRPGCDKAFSRHFNLKAHMKTHDPNRERPFTCELCLKSFIRAHDLLRHQPVHTKIKEFECDICQKRFTRKDAKDRHMLLGKCK